MVPQRCWRRVTAEREVVQGPLVQLQAGRLHRVEERAGRVRDGHLDVRAAVAGHGTVVRTRERMVQGELRRDREWRLSAPYARDLAERAGKIVTRDELLHLVWGYESPPVTRTVDNFIFRLRQKIERDPRHPQFIHTVYGDGYRLTIPI